VRKPTLTAALSVGAVIAVFILASCAPVGATRTDPTALPAFTASQVPASASIGVATATQSPAETATFSAASSSAAVPTFAPTSTPVVTLAPVRTVVPSPAVSPAPTIGPEPTETPKVQPPPTAIPTSRAAPVSQPPVRDTSGGPTTRSKPTQRNSGGSVTMVLTWNNPGSAAEALDFSVVMDTHSVDLDGYDLSSLATLRNDREQEVSPAP
jgi:hypothetical protein